MGKTFVNFKNSGFWVSDGVLEVWLRLLILHLDPQENSMSSVEKMRAHWILASSGNFTGCVPVKLEDFAGNIVDKNIILNASQALLNALMQSPKVLKSDFLNLLGIEGEFFEDLDKEKLIEVGQLFIELLKDK